MGRVKEERHINPIEEEQQAPSNNSSSLSRIREGNGFKVIYSEEAEEFDKVEVMNSQFSKAKPNTKDIEFEIC